MRLATYLQTLAQTNIFCFFILGICCGRHRPHEVPAIDVYVTVCEKKEQSVT